MTTCPDTKSVETLPCARPFMRWPLGRGMGIAWAFALLLALGLPSVSHAVPVTLTYDFDTAGDNGQSIDGWTDVMGQSFPAASIFSNSGNFGGRGTGGFTTGGNQDSQHPNHIMRSPEFWLTSTSSIDFQIAGGAGFANTYNTSADVPVGNSSGTGQQKFYLRRVSDDSYLLDQRRGSNANSYQSFSWDVLTIAAAIAGDAPTESYTVEWVDTYHGSWGFAMIDDVVLTDVLTQAPISVPEPATAALGLLALGGLMRRRRRMA